MAMGDGVLKAFNALAHETGLFPRGVNLTHGAVRGWQLLKEWPPDYQMASENWPGIAKLAEECGELVQIIMKIIGTGGTMRFRDFSVVERRRLVEEMGDVEAAWEFVAWNCLSTAERDALSERVHEKLALFESWKATEGAQDD